MVDHGILVAKLETYGCSGTTSEWFSSYLRHRNFRVQLEAARSEKVVIGPYGVPQGTVLGSTLFIISENDLPEATMDKTDQQTVMYVDDSNDQVAAPTP